MLTVNIARNSNFCFGLSHSADDSVYMESKEHRNEYVLEDTGSIWRGTSDYKAPLQWKFGQVRVELYSKL